MNTVAWLACNPYPRTPPEVLDRHRKAFGAFSRSHKASYRALEDALELCSSREEREVAIAKWESERQVYEPQFVEAFGPLRTPEEVEWERKRKEFYEGIQAD